MQFNLFFQLIKYQDMILNVPDQKYELYVARIFIKKSPIREIDQKKSAVEKSGGKSGTLTVLVLIEMVGDFF